MLTRFHGNAHTKTNKMQFPAHIHPKISIPASHGKQVHHTYFSNDMRFATQDNYWDGTKGFFYYFSGGEFTTGSTVAIWRLKHLKNQPEPAY